MYELVILSCGASKVEAGFTPPPAIALYAGGYYKAMRAAALVLCRTGRAGIWILSAKHGLVHADTPLEPYEMGPGDPGAVTPAHVANQARLYGLQHEDDVAIVGGSWYVDLARTIWPHAATPVVDRAQRLGGAGMGYQIKAAYQIANATPKRGTPA